MLFFTPQSVSQPSRRDRRAVERVRDVAKRLEGVTDENLRELADQLRNELRGQSPTSVPHIEALAFMTEAMRRTTGKVYYDVQLLAGSVLSRGAIAEMQTGEGKTITTALPACELAFYGRGVHVATTNAYLAERDCEEIRPAFELLGFTVGLLPDEHDNDIKLHAYQCDVTYGTGYEFGFDFLRDQIALRNKPKHRLGAQHIRRLRGLQERELTLLQRPHAFAIIDEADSVLIDEATMPLILSSPRASDAAERLLQLAHETADGLQRDVHFEIDDANKSLEFTDEGWSQLHLPLYEASVTGLTRPWSQYIEQALRATLFLHRDVDYVIREDEVQIVDQNTGRIHKERSWRNGQHQAVELKEGVAISPEKDSDGRISRQRYFQFYERVCGMTGTASGNEAEFREFYSLPVTVIPTHRPSMRTVLPTRGFASHEARNDAIVLETRARRATGQPVLIGTRTIAHSLELHKQLTQAGITHTVLNGVQDEEESAIVAKAGVSGTVTIATNMAGRGTDIKPDKKAKAAGGLHVIAAEHNFSARVDRQLSGRAARQGDPGSAQFFVAAEDEIFVVSESKLPEQLRNSANETGEAKQSPGTEIAAIQKQLEHKAFLRRQSMFRQDHWMESVMEVLEKRG